jgi:hypothetical protein
MRKANGDPATINFYNLCYNTMNPKKKITPLELLNDAYDDAANAVEFCNWYSLNRINLQKLEKHLIINTWDEAIDDAESDIEHAFNGIEYWTINYKKDEQR